MVSPATLLDRLIILAHEGNNAAFARAHGLSPQYVGQVLKGKGSGMSYAHLDRLAKADGYTVGIVLHPSTGEMVADALAHVRAAAIEARHILEWQEDAAPDIQAGIDLLDSLIERLQ